MMQPAGGMMQPPPMAPPPMDQQQSQPQQWAMMPPPPPQQQYYQAAPAPPLWNQQLSQVPPPVPQPMPQPQQQYQAPAPVPPPQMHYQAPASAPAPSMAPQPASADEIRTLWIGDMQYWMDENYLYSCFLHTGEVVSVKVIRNKQTGQSEGYGFIEFVSRAAADRVLQTYNGQVMPNTEQPFRLNWATCGAGERRGDGADYTIFVGDLAADVTDYMLQETFKNRYASVKGANVVTDRLTGRSKGYGFVKLGDLNEQTRAMTEMNGVYCSTRPMRIGPAANKKTLGTQQQYPTNVIMFRGRRGRSRARGTPVKGHRLAGRSVASTSATASTFVASTSAIISSTPITISSGLAPLSTTVTVPSTLATIPPSTLATVPPCTFTTVPPFTTSDQPFTSTDPTTFTRMPSTFRDRWLITLSTSGAFNSRELATVIGSILKGHFQGPYNTWRSIPQQKRDLLWKKFKEKFKWDSRIEDAVYDAWDRSCMLIYSSMLYGARQKAMVVCNVQSIAETRGQGPTWMSARDWDDLIDQHWLAEEWEELGRPSNQLELFERMHRRERGRGRGTVVDARSTNVRALTEQYGEVTSSQPIFDPAAWVDATEDYSHDHLYGFGHREDVGVLFETSSSASCASGPSISSQQQTEMECSAMQEIMEKKMDDFFQKMRSELEDKLALRVQEGVREAMREILTYMGLFVSPPSQLTADAPPPPPQSTADVPPPSSSDVPSS